jgi:alkanesulfonate monooxygenase SsuD/methylene tetrahydromethanopterin reductase-like flavin-dependent oxidoreductase (luciferase family)
VLAQHAAALADASGGRFVLGLGSSSDVIVERWNEIPFERPLSRMRRAVETLRPVLAGERGPGGFRLDAPPAEPVPIVVAALRGRMLALAAELADGGFTNLLPVSGAAQVVEAFGAPGKELVCRYFAFPGPERDGLAAARRLLLGYATVPVYAAFYDWLGWSERLEPVHAAWREGDRRRALELMPDDLVREVALLGPPEAQRERMDEFAAAGITTHVITPMGDPSGYGAQIDALRPVR